MKVICESRDNCNLNCNHKIPHESRWCCTNLDNFCIQPFHSNVLCNCTQKLLRKEKLKKLGIKINI